MLIDDKVDMEEFNDIKELILELPRVEEVNALK